MVYRNLYFWLIYFCLQIQGVTHLLLELLYCSPWLCFIYILQCHWFQPQAAGQSAVSPERAPPYFHNLIGVFICQSCPWQQLTQMNHSPLYADAINITHILIDILEVLDSEWCLMSAHRLIEHFRHTRRMLGGFILSPSVVRSVNMTFKSEIQLHLADVQM